MKQKKEEGGLLWAIMVHMAALLIAPMASSLIQPVGSLLMNVINGKGVMRAAKGQEVGFLPSLALPLVINVMSVRRYNKMDQVDKKFQFHCIL